jgi:hypothetical protein
MGFDGPVSGIRRGDPASRQETAKRRRACDRRRRPPHAPRTDPIDCAFRNFKGIGTSNTPFGAFSIRVSNSSPADFIAVALPLSPFEWRVGAVLIITIVNIATIVGANVSNAAAASSPPCGNPVKEVAAVRTDAARADGPMLVPGQDGGGRENRNNPTGPPADLVLPGPPRAARVSGERAIRSFARAAFGRCKETSEALRKWLCPSEEGREYTVPAVRKALLPNDSPRRVPGPPSLRFPPDPSAVVARRAACLPRRECCCCCCCCC